MIRRHTPFVAAMHIALALVVVLTLSARAFAATGQMGLYGTVCDSEEETIALIEKCKKAGVGTLLPSLSGGGTVIWKTDKADYYTSMKDKLANGYDALAVLIKHAHAAGIKVVPSIAIGPGGKMLDAHPEWETHDRHGDPSSKTCTPSIAFSYPEARREKIALLMDLVNNYEVDGILVDYCRYPENSHTPEAKYGFYGYDKPLIDACMNLHGFDPRKEAIDSPNWKLFNRMRAETVTTFVRELRETVKDSPRGDKVRIAGFGDTDPQMEANMCGRDWAAWGQRGLIDDFYLATYTEKGKDMTAVVKRAKAALGDHVVLHAAISPFNNFVTTKPQLMECAGDLLAGGTDGLWIYREDYLSKLNLWDAVGSANDLLNRRKGAK